MSKLTYGLMIAGALVISTAAAAAKDPPYVGKWAKSTAACKTPSDTIDAPVILKVRSFDQFETHCEFSSVANQIFRWRAKARCTVDGSTVNDTLTLTVTGKTLTTRWGKGGKALVLKRC